MCLFALFIKSTLFLVYERFYRSIDPNQKAFLRIYISAQRWKALSKFSLIISFLRSLIKAFKRYRPKSINKSRLSIFLKMSRWELSFGTNIMQDTLKYFFLVYWPNCQFDLKMAYRLVGEIIIFYGTNR